ncbi:ABC transporter substrate-binding protein [Methanoculleus sp. UBA413]|jgi:iron complex transport system substrate-binding protein|uniref:ABC transporter substrate-binding protein n=1 Tax=Methanoculleus sp. UBA413 TaxID=1915509 RepID=UPI00257A48AE|nr:ABC transporter substrate-binding protein [Methanoculleus sp. UBA413]
MMKETSTVLKAIIAVSLIALLAFTCGCTGQGQATDSETKVITDMAGREVVVPKNIDGIVTIGSVPVLNSFMFVMGQGDKIANGLPDSFVKQGRWKYQYVISPDLKNKPSIQPTTGDINLEELMKINPDVAFTMSMPSVEALDKNSIPVIYLAWTDAEDVKNLMLLLGEVFDEQERAERYIRYFDETTARPGKVVASIPDGQRPKVLFCNYKSMSTGLKIDEWFIEKAGGIAVSKTDRVEESMTFDLEQLLAWDPDVIILNSQEIALVQNDTRLSGVSAVKNGNVYVAPMGAHYWAHRTSETPLMVLWTAKTIYPEQFKDLDMEAEVMAFYKEFFGCEITRDQAAEILSGTAGRSPA